MLTKPKNTTISDLNFWKGFFFGGVIAFVILFGYAALRDSAPAATDVDVLAAPDQSITFSIEDRLGPNQVREEIDVYVDGSLVGTLNIDTDRPVDVLEVNVSEAGRHSYRVVSTTHTREGSRIERHSGTGSGTMDIAEGDSFNSYYSTIANSDNWTISLLED